MADKTKLRLFLRSVIGLLLASRIILPSHADGAPGDLDTTFGVGGKVTTDFSSGEDHANAVAIQPDGKIVVAGVANFGFNSKSQFALARYNTDGTLDIGFGTGGKVTTSFSGGADSGQALAIQADGRILVAGSADIFGPNPNFALARYNTDGTLDTSFGTGGKVTTDFAGGSDGAGAVAIQSDGKIVLAGHSFTGSGSVLVLARYNTDGTLDPSFGTGGKVITPGLSGSALAIQSDGKLLVAGGACTCSLGRDDDFALARYNTDGTLDTTFGTAGKVTTSFSSGADDALALAIQSDGKFVVAGVADNFGPNPDFALARYNTDGTLDTSFGVGGKVTTDFSGGNDVAFGVAIQFDGEIVVAGVADFNGPNSNFALARYNMGGTLDTSFGTVGKVTTDFSGGNDAASALKIQSDGGIVAAGVTNLFGPKGSFALARYEGAAPTPQALTTALVVKVDALVNSGMPNQGQGNSLISKLQQVIASLDRSNTSAACNQSQAFNNEVAAMIRSGVLTGEQGQALITSTTDIMEILGCR